jgi:outer membrane protein TolC
VKKRLSVLLTLIFVLTLVPGIALAKEPATPELSLNQAIENALKYNHALRKADYEIDRTKELRDYRSDQLGFAPIGIPNDPRVEVAYSNLLMADLNWEMAKRSLSMEEDRLVMDVCNKYWGVLQARENLKAKERALKQAELEMRQTDANLRVGLATPLSQHQSKLKLEGVKADLSAAENELEDAYTKLNDLIRLWPQDRPILTDKVELHPLGEIRLDYAVQQVIEQSPALWLAQEKATMQTYLEDLMFYTGEYRPYQARKIEVQQAELDALSARDAIRLATRELYYAVRNLEEVYKTAGEGVKTAEEALRVTRLMHALGMATAVEVAQREAALAEAEKGLVDIAAQHSYMKLAFQKPWALAR